MAVVQTGFPGIRMEPDWLQASKDVGQQMAFLANTMNNLNKIRSYKIGRELLDLIAKRHAGVGTSGSGDDRTVTIRMQKDESEGADTKAWTAQNKYHVEKQFLGRTLRFAGKGSRTIVYYHNKGDSEQIYTRLAGVRTPTFVALAHELIHALHHLSGTTYEETLATKDGEIRREEMFTTGIGPYKHTRLSENALRAEAGLPLRPHYYFPGDAAQVKSLVYPSFSAPSRGFWLCGAIRSALWG